MPQSEIKICQNCQQEFVIEPEDFDFYEKIQVPGPTFCPECREQRRIAFRNERALYKKKCDLCGKEIISRVSPDKSCPVYCRECWWSDRWDSLKYGRVYDFSQSFFEQYHQLLLSTPHISILNQNTVDSDWVNQETDDKNCYLNVGGHYNEDSAYNTYSLYGKWTFDNFWVLNSELAYENLNCERCYKIFFSEFCFNSQDIAFSFDCRNCSNLLGCAGLRNKKYCLFNKQVSQQEYQRFITKNPLSSSQNINKIWKQSEKIWLSVPHRFALIQKSINTSGNIINTSKNAKNCWNVEDTEEAKYIYIGGWLKNSYDESSHGATELGYECSSGGGIYHPKFLVFCLSGDPLKTIHSSYLEYCYSVVNSNNCFGCANLHDKQYCIFNKQYSKESFSELRTKIIQHMNDLPYVDKKGRIYKYGEFFPIELSPFGYNETAAMDYYPLTRSQSLEEGYLWCDFKLENKYEFSDYTIPDDIRDVGDDILKKILKCEVSGQAYKIIPMELQFYRHMGLPIPRRAPLQRHKDRIAKLLPRKLYDRQCQCPGKQNAKNKTQNVYLNTITHFHGDSPCLNKIKTPYAPDRPEVIYCEQCYQQEIS